MTTPNTPADLSTRRAAFRSLHEQGCFVIPNPWDPGSARYLQRLGFQALATSSSGFAFSRGLPDLDDAVTRDAMLAHIAEIVSAVGLPVSADFKSGYGREPEDVARSVRLCVETGVAGLSVEDSTEQAAHPLFDLPLAAQRIAAARASIDASASGVLLTARAECFLVGDADPLKESIRRLQAYAEAGADVLFAPGIHKREDIRTLTAAVAPKPVNVLVGRDIGLTLSELRDLGVRRISVGSALARAAWTRFMAAAKEIATEGRFAGLGGLASFADINALFRDDSSN
jgi:2-methylisocitrate lyase-like PEP mutase family enzyme